MRTLKCFFKFLKNFFALKKLKKPPSKVAQNNLNPLFFLTAWATQTAQTEEFMLQNVANRPTVYRTGACAKWTRPLFAENTTSILNKVIKASVNNRFLHMLDYFCTYYFWSIETSILIIKLFCLIYRNKGKFFWKIVIIPSLCITIPLSISCP